MATIFKFTRQNKKRYVAIAIGAVLLGAAFATFHPYQGAASEVREVRPKYLSAYARPNAVPFPEDNVPNVQRVTLGKTLFFDPRLSASSFISCATCHNPALSWGDGMAKGIGHGMKQLGRRTPTVLNTAWADQLFWDGRAGSLEEQALGPIKSPGEMNMPLADMIARLKAIDGYKPMFDSAYPGEGISEATVSKALASFERTVVSGTAPFDEWVAGKADAISASAKRGFVLFNTTANCVKCHSGWNFTDNSFQDVGVSGTDPGRAKILPLASMQHAFKTPTLRNVAQRAPYMHDGSEATLAAVVDMYDAGGREKRASLSPMIVPLHLSPQDKQDLVAFMERLTGNDAPVSVPLLPH